MKGRRRETTCSPAATPSQDVAAGGHGDCDDASASDVAFLCDASGCLVEDRGEIPNPLLEY